MGGIGGPELFLVLLVVLLVFGPKKIPEFARGIGKGLREFRKLSTDFQREINLSAALEEEKRETPRSGPPGSVSGTGRPPGPPVSDSGAPAAGSAAVATADEPGSSAGAAPSGEAASEAGSSAGAAPSGEAASPPADAPVESSDSRKSTDGS